MNLHEAIEADRELAIPHPELVREFRRYAVGDQNTPATPEQRRYAGALIAHPTIDNACDLVLTTAASRLEFTGYRVEDPAVQAYLDELVVKNHLTDVQYDVHYRTLRDGNHYLGLAWTPERQGARTGNGPTGGAVDLETGALMTPELVAAQRTPLPGGRVSVHHEPAWDGETGMFVGYDALGNAAYAVKDFVQVFGEPPAEHLRRVVYFPDRIERYLADGQGWVPFTLPGEDPNGRGVVPWTKRDGRPLGVPVVHFSHGRFGRAPYGASDLAGVLGLQDHLNAALLDLAASAQLTAFPMLKVRGIDPKDARLLVGPGRVVGSSNPDSDVQMMLPGDLSQLASYHGRLLDIIARVTATPQHLIGAGEWPSGVAIQRVNEPLIAKATRLATTIGPAWATVAHRATEMANAFGGAALDEDALITALFAPPEQLDAESQAAMAKLTAEAYATAAQIDDPVILLKTGLFTSEEVAQIGAGRENRLAIAPPVAEF
jgi:Phage portal protein, SPP1 Gp6-like